MKMNSVPELIEDIRQGKMIILMDDEDRENEGDLTIAAEKVTPEIINFMATHGRGLICLALSEEQVERLKLPMMNSPAGILTISRSGVMVSPLRASEIIVFMVC